MQGDGAPVREGGGSLEPTVRLAKVNTDEQQMLANCFAIRGIPTMVLLRQGREIGRQSGVMDAAGIQRRVAEALS